MTSARKSAEVGRRSVSLSTAHLKGLQAPAMRGVHASLNHIATSVVIVRIVVAVRVIAVLIRIVISVVVIWVEAKAAPEGAITESTPAKKATTAIVESATITESAGQATMEAATAKAATV